MEQRARFFSNSNERQQTAVYRTVWFVIATAVLILVGVATPLRYRMLQSDVYDFGEGLAALGLSLDFFAAYFVGLELLVVAGSLFVAGLIVWKRADDWFAMLVALGLALLGLSPPLIDGLHFANSQWAVPISTLRLFIQTIVMAIFCLYPNGRFQPNWTRWLLIGWSLFALGVLLTQPLMLVDTAVLPNTRTWQDAIWLLVGVAWYSVAIWGQVIRYRRHASPLEKQQMKWVLLGFAVLVLFTIVVAVLLISNPSINNTPANRAGFTLVMGGAYLLIALLGLPAAISFSIVRYRLWDVDILLNRTLVYGGLTGLVTAVYMLLVGGLELLAIETQSQLTALVIVSVLMILGLRPLYRWLDRQAIRIVPVAVAKSVPSANEPAKPAFVKMLKWAWIVNFLFTLFLFSLGITEQMKLGIWQNVADIPQFSDVAIARLLAQNAFISHPDFGALVLAASYGQAIIFASVGLFIFYKKSDDLMGIVASWMFLSVGVGFTPTIVGLPLLAPHWHVPVTLFQIGLFGSIPLFLALFPNDRFYPRWSKSLLLMWFIFTLLWIPFPQLNLHRSADIRPAFIFAVAVLGGIVAQLFRYRFVSNTEQKQQTKWVILGFLFANMGLISIGTLTELNLALSTPAQLIGFIFLALGPLFIPLTVTVALLRYRLWQIDIIFNRTLVYGGVTAVILLTYALAVGGLSLLWRTENNLLVSLFATGLIAVLFQPVRERLQRAANRLMFGERDDPYRVLSKLGSQLQTNATPEAMLQSVVGTIASTLKLPYVAIELDSEQGRLPSAATGQAVTETAEFPLRYQNETVGYLVVSPRSPSEPFGKREHQLLTDIAGQTGAAAYSVRLTTALQRSRERLVLTREEERRRIRRDLHDELGPTLASQTFALDTAIDLLEQDPSTAVKLLQSLKSQNQATVANIRRLVYQLRPPSLDELGLTGALQAHTSHLRGATVPRISLTTVPDSLPPLSAAVEVAAYRIALEALNNVVRHSQAQHCEVCLRVENNGRSALYIIVSDDGVGLPLNRFSGVGLNSMRERAEELGGSVAVENKAKGVRVTAVLPL